MADIVTRLLLDTSKFDANLNSAKGSVNNYQNSISSMAKTAGAGVMKFAGAIGIAVTAGEGFMKVIRSSQTTSDEFDNTMNSCKWTVDLFFESLNKGDFSAFRNGIWDTIRDMKELSALRDSLADAKKTANYNMVTFDIEFAKREAIIRDKNLSKEERLQALEEAEVLAQNLASHLDDTNQGVRQTILTSLNTRFKDVNFSMDDLDLFLSVGNNDFSTHQLRKQSEEYDNKINELEKQRYNYTYVGGGVMAGSSIAAENQEIVKQIKLLKEQNPLLEKQRLLRDDKDENRDQQYEDALFEKQVAQKVASVEKQMVRLKNSLNEKKDKPNPGSIDEIELKLRNWRKKFNEATTEEARNVALKMIEELTQQKKVLEFQAKIEFSKKDIEETIKGFSFTPQGNNLIQQSQERFKHTPKKKTEKEKAEEKALKNLKDNSVTSLINKKDIDLNQQYAESLSAIGSVLGNLSGAFDDNTASILQWGSTMLYSIGQTIAAFGSLIPAKEADIAVTNRSTIANVQNAKSGVFSAHAGIPFVGVAMGLAGIASIVAAMTSIPGFANGGIVSGGSYSGDNVLARVNSGEMILNSGQQSRLFRVIDSGNVGMRNTNLSGEVHFKIRDNSLVGVLRNHSKRTNKLR